MEAQAVGSWQLAVGAAHNPADRLDLAARRLVHHYFGGGGHLIVNGDEALVTVASLHPFADELRRACGIPLSEFDGGGA